jgi:anti-anti-sigma regulatory factor
MRIAIAESTGPVAAGRSTAADLRSTVESTVRDETVIIDFAGVRAVAPSFADELLAKLPGGMLDGGRIRIEGADPTTERLIDLVRRRRVVA